MLRNSWSRSTMFESPFRTLNVEKARVLPSSISVMSLPFRLLPHGGRLAAQVSAPAEGKAQHSIKMQRKLEGFVRWRQDPAQGSLRALSASVTLRPSNSSESRIWQLSREVGFLSRVE